MKSLRTLLPLVSVLGLGAAFFAGYEVRGRQANEGEVEPSAKFFPRQRPGALTGGVKPFASGQADAWVHHLDDLKDLHGRRLKMYVAKECSTLDVAGAEELLSRCDEYIRTSGACFGRGWYPNSELTQESELDALARLADLDLDRAFEVLKNSERRRDQPELGTIVVVPLAARDFDRVLEFLKTVPLRGPEYVDSLISEPAIFESPEKLLQLTEFCPNDGAVLGRLLEAVSSKNPTLGRETLRKMVVADPYSFALPEAAAGAFDGFRNPKQFMDWAISANEADRTVIQNFAIQALMDNSSSVGAAADLYRDLAGNFPDGGERYMLLRRVTTGLGEAAEYKKASEWLDTLSSDDRLRAFEIMVDCRASEADHKRTTGGEQDQSQYWLNRMPESDAKNWKLSEYADSLARKGQDPGRWVDLISDPEVKAQTLKEVQLQSELRRLRSE